MKNVLALAEKADLKGKVGGAFGLPGCTHVTAERLYDFMKNILKMDMVDAPFCLEAISTGKEMRLANAYGQKIAGKLLPKG